MTTSDATPTTQHPAQQEPHRVMQQRTEEPTLGPGGGKHGRSNGKPEWKRVIAHKYTKIGLGAVLVFALGFALATFVGGSDPAPTTASAPTGTAEPSNDAADGPAGDESDAAKAGISSAGTLSCEILPADNPWNTDISDLPVHERSAAWVESIGADEALHSDFGTTWEGAPNGIPYAVVDGDAPEVPVSFDYEDESDPGPYRIPPEVAVEGGSDDHVIVVDDADCMLYELFGASSDDGGSSWSAGSGAVFDLSSNELRPDTWTSADAAGLPIFPGLVRYDEVVEAGSIDHALRFTAEDSRRAFIHPATHYASDIADTDVPPMGARFRLKADFDCSAFGEEVQVICAALKQYGMFLADNGSDWFVSGAPDSRWNDETLSELGGIPGSAFEAVDTGEPIVTDDD